MTRRTRHVDHRTDCDGCHVDRVGGHVHGASPPQEPEWSDHVERSAELRDTIPGRGTRRRDGRGGRAVFGRVRQEVELGDRSARRRDPSPSRSAGALELDRQHVRRVDGRDGGTDEGAHRCPARGRAIQPSASASTATASPAMSAMTTGVPVSRAIAPATTHAATNAAEPGETPAGRVRSAVATVVRSSEGRPSATHSARELSPGGDGGRGSGHTVRQRRDGGSDDVGRGDELRPDERRERTGQRHDRDTATRRRADADSRVVAGRVEQLDDVGGDGVADLHRGHGPAGGDASSSSVATGSTASSIDRPRRPVSTSISAAAEARPGVTTAWKRSSAPSPSP